MDKNSVSSFYIYFILLPSNDFTKDSTMYDESTGYVLVNETIWYYGWI